LDRRYPLRKYILRICRNARTRTILPNKQKAERSPLRPFFVRTSLSGDQPIDIRLAFPPAAAVLMVTVCSLAKRLR
jgi:hypothetical protein